MTRLFGTDGVRGIANKEITCDLAMNIGKACALVLSRERENVRVLIGHDGRESADMLVSSLIAGFTSFGVDVIDVGMIPTPAISYLVGKYDVDAGVMVTASHNPYIYNGIKIFNRDGYKLSDELEDEIEKIISEKMESFGDKVGTVIENRDGVSDYVDHLLSCVFSFGSVPSFDGLNIAIDCSNGASSVVAEKLFSKLGCQYHILNHEPDGRNINDGCGSLYPSSLSEYVVSHHMDGGVAFDGDADRAIFVDELGNILDGDYVLAILGSYMKENKKLSHNTIVGTVMSNLGFIRFCEEKDIRFLATKVGDRYVLEQMLKGEFSLGGEQSGHVILKDYANTGDGELTALMLFAVLVESGKRLSELTCIMKKYPQVLVNVEVSNEKKNEFYNNKKIEESISKASSVLGNTGRVLVRPSGTEPLIRVMVEGENTQDIQRIAHEIGREIELALK